jgi:hypothetical protein
MIAEIQKSLCLAPFSKTVAGWLGGHPNRAALWRPKELPSQDLRLHLNCSKDWAQKSFREAKDET